LWDDVALVISNWRIAQKARVRVGFSCSEDGVWSHRGSFFVFMAAPSSHVLLCATHRTGSNLLEQFIKAARHAGYPREFYSPVLSQQLAERGGLPDPTVDFWGYYDGILPLGQTSNGVFAAKIMWRHMAITHERMAPSGRVGATPWASILMLHPNPKVVWVTRRDKVRQAISMVRAKQTGVYSTIHVDRGRKKAIPPGAYDYEQIRFHVDKLTVEDAAWGELFTREGVTHRQVVFEEFIRDPEAETIRLFAAIGLPIPEGWARPEIAIRKQSDAISEEWYQRYKEDDVRPMNDKDSRREQRHRARKALEFHAGRDARWARWQGSGLGRWLAAVEARMIPGPPRVSLERAKGDGVERLQ
jgi:trehalose 2-sulfotransferase